MKEVTGTLSHGAHAGSYNGQDAYNDMLVVQDESDYDKRKQLSSHRGACGSSFGCDFEGLQRSSDRPPREWGGCDEVSHSIRANAANTFRGDSMDFPCRDQRVRRLTPMECERLQGFPDGWTDIGEWTDTKGKTHKTSDSARYKAIGNSIALPFWRWLSKRISEQYDRTPTMASLFDGIGGFPKVWEETNGPGTALWASEIEEFCIAVTKRHFVEE